MMGFVDPVLTGVTLGVVLAAGTVIGVIVPRINRASRRAQDAVGAMGASLERTLGALRTIKASGAEHREERAVHAAAEESWRQSVRAAKWSALAGNTAGLSMQVAFITVLAVGGARVATGAVDIGTLVAFLLYVFYLMAPIQQVVGAVAQYQTGSAALARIEEARLLPAEPAAEPSPLPRPGAEPAAIAFEDVRFRYDDDLPYVHHGVTFAVPPRGMTAFVGPSGAGKTTVFSLIERFYDPEQGTITLDGRDLTDWEVSALRSAIGYVEQDAPVLSGSLRDNLLLGNPDADEGELLRALKTTRLDSLVGRLPKGSTPSSATEAPSFPAVSASASPSPAPCSGGPGCCCSTRPPASSTRSTRRRCATPSPMSPAPPRSWSSPTGCPPSPWPTGSSSWTRGRYGRSAPIANSWPATRCTPSSPPHSSSRPPTTA